MVTEYLSSIPPLNEALNKLKESFDLQRKMGMAPLGPTCYLLDKGHITDNAIARAHAGSIIPTDNKHYGKVDTDLYGFNLDDPSQIYVMMVPPESTRPKSTGDKVLVYPVIEKKGGGYNYIWDVTLKFGDGVHFVGGETLNEQDIALLDKSLLPSSLVQEGNGHIVYKKIDSAQNSVNLQFVGNPSGARNLEKYARVWSGKCVDYGVNVLGVKENFFTALPKRILKKAK